jgi:hypothetical protein
MRQIPGISPVYTWQVCASSKTVLDGGPPAKLRSLSYQDPICTSLTGGQVAAALQSDDADGGDPA